MIVMLSLPMWEGMYRKGKNPVTIQKSSFGKVSKNRFLLTVYADRILPFNNTLCWTCTLHTYTGQNIHLSNIDPSPGHRNDTT